MGWWIDYAKNNEPLIYIGGRDNPYMIRWALVPRNDHANIYLHKYLRTILRRAVNALPLWPHPINPMLECDDDF